MMLDFGKGATTVMRMVISLAVAMVIVPSATAQTSRGGSLTPQHFVQTAEIQNTTLDTSASVSTKRGDQTANEISGTNIGRDGYVVALIDKRSGRISYIIVTESNYSGAWRFYDSVNFLTTAGPMQEVVDNISRDNSCTRGRCRFQEVVGFAVSPDLIRQLASYHVQGVSAPWTYRLNGRGGQETISLSTAELAGAVLAAERLATSLGYPPEHPFVLRS